MKWNFHETPVYPSQDKTQLRHHHPRWYHWSHFPTLPDPRLKFCSHSLCYLTLHQPPLEEQSILHPGDARFDHWGHSSQWMTCGRKWYGDGSQSSLRGIVCFHLSSCILAICHENMSWGSHRSKVDEKPGEDSPTDLQIMSEKNNYLLLQAEFWGGLYAALLPLWTLLALMRIHTRHCLLWPTFLHATHLQWHTSVHCTTAMCTCHSALIDKHLLLLHRSTMCDLINFYCSRSNSHIHTWLLEKP